MKITKLMLSACVAALAMVSCNKVEPDVIENTSLKSVKLSFENAIMTKGAAGEKISAGSQVQMNDFKIFLTDESYSGTYSAMDATGTNAAKFYFTAADLTTDKKYEFHYVDHKCTRVVVVANVGDMTFEDVKKYTQTIDKQQDQTNLILVADAALQATSEKHNPNAEKYTEVYKAELTLKPVISRFEVDGFSVAFSETPKFNKIEVRDIAFLHYYPSVSFTTENGVFEAVATGAHVKPIEDFSSESQVMTWFNNADNKGWFRDSFDNQIVMLPDDKTTEDVKENVVDAPAPLAYHLYAGNLVPTMVIKVLADGNPSYVYTEKFKLGTTEGYLNKLEGGKIYRMSAAGVADQTGGSIVIPDDLDPIERCLDITVDVVDWVVELVTPDFGK